MSTTPAHHLRLRHLAAATAGLAVLLSAWASPATAAEPLRLYDHVIDQVGCGGDEETPPDFLLDYDAQIWTKLLSPVQRGGSDASSRRGSTRIVETYSVGGHEVVIIATDTGHDQSVLVQGDRIYVTIYFQVTNSTWFDGRLIGQSAGTVRITESAHHNGTLDFRGDDYDHQLVSFEVPGGGRNLREGTDPCDLLAPFAS